MRWERVVKDNVCDCSLSKRKEGGVIHQGKWWWHKLISRQLWDIWMLLFSSKCHSPWHVYDHYCGVQTTCHSYLPSTWSTKWNQSHLSLVSSFRMCTLCRPVGGSKPCAHHTEWKAHIPDRTSAHRTYNPLTNERLISGQCTELVWFHVML